jgi:NAD(P)-dependent dehydrogenase (short-subunit alcohol dehydrogenase family)
MESTMPKTWFVTGASRGLGAQITKAAILAGDRVVATGRSREAVIESLGPDSDQLLSVGLDVTSATQARAAVQAALARFGTIDVLVNNARYGYLGFFEESTIRDTQAQFPTNLFGVLNVTWAVLPTMRFTRKGRIFNISSFGGILGADLGPLHCASNFALEGISESLSREMSPFGLSVTLVEAGPSRTDFLTRESLRFGDNAAADYDHWRAQLRASFERRNGHQPGDSAKLAEAIVGLASEARPPMRFFAGSVAVDLAGAKRAAMQPELAGGGDFP